jgi:hypothetical protein
MLLASHSAALNAIQQQQKKWLPLLTINTFFSLALKSTNIFFSLCFAFSPNAHRKAQNKNNESERLCSEKA